jgi:uncharacterized protein YaeQ
VALKSTIFKAELSISDMDRPYYGAHSLTIARHPSETDERMMVRLLAFALHADERLEFGKGISTDDEPALWRKDLTGAVEQWIEVGLPDERVLRKAAGRAREVIVYCYGGRGVDVWWAQNQKALSRLTRLSIFNLPAESTLALAKLVERGMDAQCTIQDGHIWFSAGDENLTIERVTLLSPA